MMRKHTETWQEIVKKWKAGDVVSTAELGGISPGYEQAIQILLFEIMHEWGDKPLPQDDGKSYPKEYADHVDVVATRLDKVYGFSSAQVGAAKSTAYQFMKYGYSEMMNKLDEDRHILVSRNFPRAEDAS